MCSNAAVFFLFSLVQFISPHFQLASRFRCVYPLFGMYVALAGDVMPGWFIHQAFSDYQLQQMTSNFIDQFGFNEEEFGEQEEKTE